MKTEIRPVKGEDVSELGRICYEAFGTLQDRHAVPRDFDDPETATMVVGMMASRPDFAGFAAVQDGRVVGSNFISFTDEVAGVGPITVDPSCQSRGVGRALMQAVVEEAKRRGVSKVRLMQEAVNTTSLSLYTSLGFQWREAVAIMRLSPKSAQDAGVRPLGDGDLDDVDRLGREHYRHSRRNEVAAALRGGFPALAVERRGRVTGYLVPGFLGHGFAETQEDLMSLLGAAPGMAPEPLHKVLVPLSQSSLYREMLSRGCRTVKVMNYMTLGEYDPPRSAWLPSIAN